MTPDQLKTRLADLVAIAPHLQEILPAEAEIELVNPKLIAFLKSAVDNELNLHMVHKFLESKRKA
jgi:hypothetical protein